MDPLPVQALRLDEPTVQALSEVGISTIGELRAVARPTIPSRFGPELLLRLDQALGSAIETIEPVREEEPLRFERLLDGPTTDLEALSIVTRGLLDTLHAALEKRCRGVRRLDAIFERPHLEPVVLTISVGRATRDAKHLWSLLWPKLERMNLGDGVEGVEVHAVRTARIRGEQVTRWVEGHGQDARATPELDQLCDTIANRIGPAGVVQAHHRDTHIPERAWGFEPVGETSEALSPGGARSALPWASAHGQRVNNKRAPEGRQCITDAHFRPSGARASGAPFRGLTPTATNCRPSGPDSSTIGTPTLLLAPPEPIDTIAGAGDAPPWRITWRAEHITVISSVGPQRIAEAWWDVRGVPRPGLDAGRDYFRVQDQRGRWLWVFRVTGTNRWYMHGLWA